MHAAKAVNRLSAGTANYSGVGPGGEPEFTQADIAQAVGQVKDRAGQLLVMRKWADLTDAAAEGELKRLLLWKVVDQLAAPEKWRIRVPGTLQRMIAAAIEEAINPLVCKDCNGKGTILKKGESGIESVTCSRCAGKGRVDPTERERAKKCEMAWATYGKTWDKRYESILRLITGLITQSLYEIKEALG